MKIFHLPVILTGLLVCFLTSCGSDPISRPFVLAENSNPQVKPNRAVTQRVPDTKATPSGQVTFSGLSRIELRDFRVVPEKGTKLIIPKNRRYDAVDGFWWKGSDPNMWFKIPNHGEAWVGHSPGGQVDVATLKNLKVYHRAEPFLGMASAILGKLRKPGWVPDSGDTRSPVASPWRSP